MNAVEMLKLGRRKKLLKIIRDEFNGVVPLQKHLVERMKEEHKSKNSTIGDLDFLVRSGLLTAKHHGADCHGITYRLPDAMSRR